MVHKWTAVWIWSAEKKFCASLDSVHACHSPQPRAHPRNLNMNDQSTARIHNRKTRTGLIRHHVGLSAPIHGSHRPTYTISKTGKTQAFLASWNMTLACLVWWSLLLWLTVKMGHGQFRCKDELWQAASEGNPPAPSHEWCNPRRAAIPPLSGVEPALLVPSA